MRGLRDPVRTLEQACADLGLDPRDWVEPRILTSHEYPPIPDRRFDWCAWYDGEEHDGRADRGWGPTEAAAIADLRKNHPRGIRRVLERIEP